ncbi:TPA: hypothetical protein DIS56_02680 [Candidatus Saccharibacteria bacterium]|nr:MAG: hypothetical protein UX30_C0006G0009 [Candidatus Saccharibacteria bacterium GW2011_GWA2_46_10]OGL36199.1 MAG: hypothetical protein A3F05_02765 [Candidatus Saccharibacteria bacterium RIFCSPHIGHO2_12_FULL_47_17]HCM52016.1 hypothetical protein [Candidatus Saccharibacteria bacterium]
MQDNKPNASKLIDALRQVGYDNYTAVADLVDNSLDAYANLVKVDIGKQRDDDHLLTVSDNGQGMDRETLTEAIRLGSNIEKNEKSDLGKYGMGLVTASISIGKRLLVVTKQSNQYMTAVHDIEQIKSNGDFVASIRPSNELEKNMFVQRVGGGRSGTVVAISNIDLLQNKNLTVFKRVLIRNLGEIYREFINAGKKIYVGSTEVQASDPLMLNVDGTTPLIDEEKEFGNDIVRLKIVALPRMSRAESVAVGINIPNQGFYLMRNNRQISRAESLGVSPLKHNDYNRFRAEIYFPASLDKLMGVTFTKNGVSIKTLDDTLKNWIDHLVQPQLLAIKHQSARDITKETENTVDHESSERAFRLKSKLLPDTIPEGVQPDKAWRQEREAEGTWKKKSMGRLGAMFEFENVGRKITVTYNTDHPFYQVVFSEVSENKELTNAIDFLSYSIAAGLSRIASPKNEKLVDTFLDTFSDSLRTLLS